MATRTPKSEKTTGGENPNLPADYKQKLETETGGAVAVVVQTEPPKTYPPRNIKYVGRRTLDRKTKKVVRDDQPVTRTAGADKIVLPSASEQKEKRIFWHDAAGRIVQLYPKLYKLVRPKGKK